MTESKKQCKICKGESLKLQLGEDAQGQFECKHCGYIGPLSVQPEDKKMKFNIGAVITEPGSTIKNKTGGWRVQKPVVDLNKCIKCGICWMYCPDSCIKIDKKKGAIIDYDYCKGDGVCANVCPVKCIKMVKEEK